MNNTELRLDDLNLDGLKIYQYKNGYNFTSDSVLLANFVKAKHTDVCVEIGAGSGIISILVEHKNRPQKIIAVEMQNTYATLCKKNVELNNKRNVEVICDRIQNNKKFITKNVDVVFSNPPYYKDGTCKESEDENIAKCKHEQFLPLNELTKCASEMLKFGGKFYVVYPANRVGELIFELKKNNLEPKKMFFLHRFNSCFKFFILNALLLILR